ncbi:Oidioi.mRNA.OKI2018_I69.chr1.g1807.t1.cds [Oikopleura dioica]|uniref:Oidioi.mRNA.OKI2018_I69.chr1.g1807.t1.cds n=1 Tax=Oikopleura dioica TaxID=34765 RepID=A0ABN7SW08_OIKDI|nr:Oidioi.mRNA.OKI2018_I69.chr1.g1807.t1.cds [Oikopleura dioica]
MGHLDEIEELTRNRGSDILISNLRTKGSFHKKHCEALDLAGLGEHVLVRKEDDLEVLVFAALSHLIVAKELLLEIKKEMENDQRLFYQFRLDNASREENKLLPAFPHCFSTFLLVLGYERMFLAKHVRFHNRIAFSNKNRPETKTFSEINEVNSFNLRAIQSKSLKSLYDVEGLNLDPSSKIDALPDIYAENYIQDEIKLLKEPEKKCEGAKIVVFVKTSRKIGDAVSRFKKQALP